MACRDYEFDYDTWLRRGREHLDRMSHLLRELRRAAHSAGIEIPTSAAEWFRDDATGMTGDLNRPSFDRAAQSLCELCRAMEERGPLPAAVVPWWTEHKANDQRAQEELAKGLSPTPIYADFWAELDAREAIQRQVTGVGLEDAIRALEKAGLRVVRRGKVITMENAERQILIPRADPVNGFALAGILSRIGLSEEAFRQLL